MAEQTIEDAIYGTFLSDADPAAVCGALGLDPEMTVTELRELLRMGVAVRDASTYQAGMWDTAVTVGDDATTSAWHLLDMFRAAGKEQG